MKQFFIFPLFFILSVGIALAVGEGTYGNETYGDASYGISSLATSFFFNNSFAVTANQSSFINATNGTSAPNVAIEFNTNSNTSGAVTIVKYTSQPPGLGTNSFSALGTYISIVVDSSIENSLNYSIIKMYYTDTEVAIANLQESTLRLNKWNGSVWIKFDPPNGGVDTVNNFVWANTTTFSTWGPYGSTNPSTSSSSGTTSGGGGGGGGSGFDWQCTSWTDCAPSGTQTRTCTQVLGSGAPSKPAETQSCTYKAPVTQTTAQPADSASSQKPAVTAANSQPSQTNSAQQASLPTGAATGITGRVITVLKKPSSIIAIVVSLIALAGLYIGYFFLYRKQ